MVSRRLYNWVSKKALVRVSASSKQLKGQTVFTTGACDGHYGPTNCSNNPGRLVRLIACHQSRFDLIVEFAKILPRFSLFFFCLIHPSLEWRRLCPVSLGLCWKTLVKKTVFGTTVWNFKGEKVQVGFWAFSPIPGYLPCNSFIPFLATLQFSAVRTTDLDCWSPFCDWNQVIASGQVWFSFFSTLCGFFSQYRREEKWLHIPPHRGVVVFYSSSKIIQSENSAQKETGTGGKGVNRV